MINGERIRQIRELRRLTQTQLAELIGLDQSAVAHIEGGRFELSQANIETIALRTGFPPSFFAQEPGPDFPLGSLQYRAHALITRTEKLSSYRYAEIVHEVAHRLMAKMKPIPILIERLDADPATAARLIRSAMGLSPDRPIPHLIHALEKAGVLVLSLPMMLERIEAFSNWVGLDRKRPVLVLLAGKPGDRLRKSAAHDLGHLVLPPRGDHRIAEREAFKFSAEFLLPEEAMRHELAPPLTLTGLAKIKAKWGVSIQALILRAKELGVIPVHRCQYLFKQLNLRKWRVQEPVFIPAEKPRALRKMAELLYGNPIDFRSMAEDARLTQQFLREMIEPYASSNEMPSKPHRPMDWLRTSRPPTGSGGSSRYLRPLLRR